MSRERAVIAARRCMDEAAALSAALGYRPKHRATKKAG
jgi:hypothetical protein